MMDDIFDQNEIPSKDFDALEAINSPRMVAAKRGKKVGDIVARRENSNSKSVAEEA